MAALLNSLVEHTLMERTSTVSIMGCPCQMFWPDREARMTAPSFTPILEAARRRLGAEALQPTRIKYKPLVRA